MRIHLSRTALTIEIAVLLTLALAVIAIGFDTANAAWHPLRLVSTDALLTISVDNDENGAIDNAERCTGKDVCEMKRIKITGGTIAAGQVLRSDANGLATWQGGSGIIASGTIIHFDGTTCPLGWEEVIEARGRYLVALQAGGSAGGTIGSALVNLENRPVPEHSHTLPSLQQHAHGNNFNYELYYVTATGNFGQSPIRYLEPKPHVANKAPIYTTTPGYSGISITPVGAGDGTNAPYIQRLVCRKQ